MTQPPLPSASGWVLEIPCGVARSRSQLLPRQSGRAEGGTGGSWSEDAPWGLHRTAAPGSTGDGAAGSSAFL